ncbi:uncharacterized protein LOC127700711 isoform X2 [Mytilus californianus]|uniref:uncharacterized protein LOC127700711 isoform X2 n=1 Tax=Mytilus californianus TaxID=6549 RepID=UPI00224806C0|nr:uncharacterized protein LOC127700711 isoform X2 [Mytilus californianus]
MGGYFVLILCFTAVHCYRTVRFQRGTNAVVKWELSQSVSTTNAAIMRNLTLIIFRIDFGSVLSNTGDTRYKIDKYMSQTITAIKFTIRNVTSDDAGVYTLQDTNTVFDGVILVITDYPVTENESAMSDDTMTVVIWSVIGGVLVVIVLIFIVVLGRNYFKKSMSGDSGTVYVNMKDDSVAGITSAREKSYVSARMEKPTVDNVYSEVRKKTEQTSVTNPGTEHQLTRVTDPETEHQLTRVTDPETEHQLTRVTDPETEHQLTRVTDPETENQQNNEQMNTDQLVYIEVTFDDDKKMEEETVQKNITRTTYEEVDFYATAVLANNNDSS